MFSRFFLTGTLWGDKKSWQVYVLFGWKAQARERKRDERKDITPYYSNSSIRKLFFIGNESEAPVDLGAWNVSILETNSGLPFNTNTRDPSHSGDPQMKPIMELTAWCCRWLKWWICTHGDFIETFISNNGNIESMRRKLQEARSILPLKHLSVLKLGWISKRNYFSPAWHLFTQLDLLTDLGNLSYHHI